MTEYGYRGPTIDHGLLSPSGRVSRRAREAFFKREAARLFAGVDLSPPVPQPKESVKLRQHAAMLRELAGRGMRPRYHRKHAAIAEAQAIALEAEGK